MKYALLIAAVLAFGGSTADAADRNDDAKHAQRHQVQNDRNHDGRHDGWRNQDRGRDHVRGDRDRNDHAHDGRRDRGWDRDRRGNDHRWDRGNDRHRWDSHNRYQPRYVYTPQRNRYHVTRYVAPRGYYARNWRSGDYLPPVYRARPYVINHYNYRLPPPPRGYHYVRVDNHAVLAAIASGLVADVVFDLFYH